MDLATVVRLRPYQENLEEARDAGLPPERYGPEIGPGKLFRTSPDILLSTSTTRR